MAYSVRWYRPGRTILVTVSDALTLDTIRAISHETETLIASGIPPIHLLVDITQLTTFPGIALDVFRASAPLSNPKVDWLVVFGRKSRLIDSILAIYRRLTRARIELVDTLEEAVALLDRMSH
jgi:hypothetical protein